MDVTADMELLAEATDSEKMGVKCHEATSAPLPDHNMNIIIGMQVSGETSPVLAISHERLARKRKLPIVSVVAWAKLPRLPNGRRPFVRTPWLNWIDSDDASSEDLDKMEDEEELEEKEEIESLMEEKEGEQRQRTDSYELDSFVCQTGYLSEDELQETPQAGRSMARVLMHKKRNQESKKVEKLDKPDVLGVEFWSGKGTAKRAFKKWNGVVLLVTTWGIPTGLSDSLSNARKLLTVPSASCSDLPSADLQFYRDKYVLKYWVKKRVADLQRTGLPTDLDPCQLMRAVDEVMKTLDVHGDMMRGKEQLLRRYVVKYVCKFVC